MSLQLSNGFKEQVAAFFKSKFDGGVIRIFTGTQPAHSDLAETGTLLGVITLDGIADNGLVFEASGPYVIKDPLVSWVLTTIANGDCGYFRLVADPADAGGDSYNALRADGAISADPGSGAEMIMNNISVLTGRTYSIDAFVYTLPPILGA